MRREIILLALLVAAGCRWEQDAEERFVNAVARAKQESANPYGLRPPLRRDAIQNGTDATPDPDESDPDSMIIKGKVAETMDAGGYTYVRVTTGHGDIWAAVPQTALHVGDPVTVDGELTMENFESKRLRRTFTRIIFGTIEGSRPLLPDEPATATNISIA